MGQYSDARGVLVTAGDRKLVDQLDEAATLFHGYFADPVAAVDRALEGEPGFIMGLALKGGIYATSSEKAAEPVLDEILARLKPLAVESNARERGHISALESWRAGRFDAATEDWGRILLEYPRDLIALQFAHLGDFLLAQSLTLRDRPAHRYGSRVAQRQAECSKGAGVSAARLQAEESAQSRAGQALRGSGSDRLVSRT